MFKLRKYLIFLNLCNTSIQLFVSVYVSCVAQNANHVFIIAETEHVSLSHLQLAQSMREEAKKLEEFREKQKEMRKKVASLSTFDAPR